MNEKKRDWPVLISIFLALGGNGMMIIFCGLIGFGLHSILGKLALYISFALQAVNLLIIACRRRTITKSLTQPHPTSKKMRRFHGVFLGLWIIGAAALLFSLAMNLFGLSMADAWVMYPCLIGSIVVPIGWLGILASFHRRKQETTLLQAA